MEYLLFEDTQLNPNEKFIKAITKRIQMNDDYCPCDQGDTLKSDTKCPCKAYRDNHYCCCTLYVKK